MQSTQITLRNLQPSAMLTRRIREKCEQLEKFHGHILHCRAQVAREQVRGTSGAYTATVRIAIPGREVVVSRAHPVDVHLAVREAFAAMRRSLKDAAT